jgi:hypothetical protein
VILALKLTLAPALVVLATLAGRRWGQRVAGAVTALPVVAGPILAIITIEQGRAFGEAAARSALLAILALAAFCVAFGRVAAAGRPWPVALLGGWGAYGVVAAGVAEVDAPPVLGLAAALIALGVAGLLIGPPPAAVPRTPPPWWDLPARAALTAALVVIITGAANGLGPAWSGVLTPFPIATTVMVAFVHGQDGPVALRTLLAGFVRALPGFALSFFLAAVLL